MIRVFYSRLARPILFRFPSEQIHDQTLRALEVAQRNKIGRLFLRFLRGPIPYNPVFCAGLSFANPLGMAAGFDKDVRVAQGLAELGFGHIEVGTLTPRPQQGNPHPRIFRLPEDGALINRMGFPNGGVQAALPRLQAVQRRNFILGVSLGKQKETPLEEAAQDYVTVMQQVYPFADYLAVNISSPNTVGLRQLQGRAYLEEMLRELMRQNQLLAGETKAPKPLFVKIAPDLTESELQDVIEVAVGCRISGLIATNTTIGRPAELRSPQQKEQGGLSGAPLRQKSTATIRTIRQHCSLPIIGAGGVFSADDVREKLDAGATLVQLYTSLIYGGPRLIGRILRQLKA